MQQKLDDDAAERAMATQATGSSLVSRAYQIEMFEASLHENTIVVMDTGSGKTHVAILRIMYELEHGDERKLVWFLAPTVTLCEQQHRTLQESFPAVSTRLIVGSDNVECWQTKDIWDDILRDQRIVVTTHAVLSDALFHGFVVIERLALLIYDEGVNNLFGHIQNSNQLIQAHHCTGEHPANKIMKDHYYPCLMRAGRESVPAVLGLTASPVMSAGAKLEGLQMIERNLDSITKTPRLHREDLRKFVHLPSLIQLQFAQEICIRPSTALGTLHVTIEEINILQDPIVVQLIAGSTTHAKLEKVLQSGRTRNQDTLRRFCAKADHVASQLGPWATDMFILLAAAKLEEAVTTRRDIMFGWDDKDQDYLHNILHTVCNHPTVSDSTAGSVLNVSGKVRELLRYLSTLPKSAISGIIFVEQRAVAALLCKILSVHPDTRHLSCGTFVGTANNSKRRAEIGDLASAALHDQVLEAFRIGTCNLIVATSVLEEGIDISSCNLVICFDGPPNLKSFVQRRGRARDRKSNFITMAPENDISRKKIDWRALEEEMVRAYQEEGRVLEAMLQLENSEDNCSMRYEIQSTRAVLTYEIALQHLNHFCNTLPKTDHVENCPIFIVHEHPLTGFRRAEVILPNSIDPSVRRTFGRQYWKTERQAKKDASFETYLALYRADLVNDYLLPAPRLTQGPSFKIEDSAAMASISPCINPWVLIATDWREAAKGELHAVVITIRRPTQANLQMLLILPKKPPAIAECKLFWNSDTEYHATFTSKRFCDFGFDQEPLELYRTANDLILESIHHQKRALKQGDKVLLFSPLVDQLAPWLMANSGAMAASEVKASDQLAPATNIVRSPSLFNMPLLFDSWTEENTLKATTFPRRRNFLAPNNSNSQLVALTKSHVLAVQNTTFDLLSSDAIAFSLLIPSLEHHIGKILLSNKLCSELLAEVGFTDVSLVVEALCATSANSSMNYERLELIGDSTLKFIVAIQLFATKPKWHEGYLSAAKDCIVANSRLARAALDEGLDKYIITEPFSPRKWRACCVNDMIQHDPTPIRKVSSKVLADVVEALIGAALIDRGLSGATKCAHRFMPEVHLQMPREYLEPLLCCLESPKGGCPPHLAQVEALLNYKFQNPSLLTESLTHPSLASDFSTPSYQRLEFLGDAVLDMLIIRKLASYRNPTISHVQMHLIKSALVNATFLAFLCMEMSGKKEITDIVRVRSASVSLEATVRSIRKQKRVALHEFLRFSPSATSLIRERQACLLRYDSLAPRIRAAMEISTEHPWALLSQLNAPKFLSDIVEALIGAVFVDSHGDLGACEQLAGRFGLTQYLGRIIEDKVGVLHPKSRLGELVGRKDGKKERGKNKVKYTIRKEEEEEGKVGYRCHVSIGDAVFDEIREGLTRDEVTTRAANVAVHVLLAKKETFNVCEDC